LHAAVSRRTINAEEDDGLARRIQPWKTSHSEIVLKPVKSSPGSWQLIKVEAM
jgi:hypothetical protein